MKILLVSSRGDGAWFVHLLSKEGHKVDWAIKDPDYADSLLGIVPRPISNPKPENYDLVVFDSSGLGSLADAARKVTPTIGGSSFCDRLEDDRMFGLEIMEQAKIKVPDWEAFSDKASALKWLKANNVRAVLKPIDADLPDSILKASTYVSKGRDDMVNYIETGLHPKIKSFVLQEFVEGVEISTEGWWTGTEWVAMNHTLEEKKFMAGGLGPNTGCAGNALWMILRQNPLWQAGLAKMGDIFKAHGFVGMVDLNMIVTEGEAYGLEWTPRFGYEGTSNFTRLLPIHFGDFLYAVAVGKTPTLTQPRAKFAVTTMLSVPPYPSAELAKGKRRVPIKGLDLDHLENFILYDVKKEGEDVFVEGKFMGIGCPITTGPTIEAAFVANQAVIDSLQIPDLQYRNDLAKCITKRYSQLERWGWLRQLG